jgi:TolB protein
MAASPKLLLAGAVIVVSAGIASAQQGGAAGHKDSILAFVSERDGNSEIYVMDFDGTGLLRLTNDAGRDTDPTWSPDGKRIAFVSDRAGSSDIYVMDADGSNVVRRTQTGLNGAPAWSPDGSKIAFSSLRGGQFGIYVMNVDGDWANPTRVGYDRGFNGYPAWSPDGGRIAFVSDWRAFDFLFDVYVMNADGSDIVSLFAGPFFSKDGQTFYFQPSWSPDGQQMAVVVCGYAWDNCYPSSSIAIANGDGLTTLVQAGGFARPAWSPDGSTIAFSIKACRDCAGSLRYVSRDGTKSGLIFSNGHSPAWRPERGTARSP